MNNDLVVLPSTIQLFIIHYSLFIIHSWSASLRLHGTAREMNNE